MDLSTQAILKKIRRWPDATLPPGTDVDQFLQPWGFTIYRTFYRPNSDQHWEQLLDTITARVHDALGEQEGAEDAAALAKTQVFFKLDARSDSATLNGLTLEQVQQLYINKSGGQPLNSDNDPFRVFILADEEVLAQPNLATIKIVAADYTPPTGPPNWRFPVQHYFGWLTMSSKDVLYLWFWLDSFLLEEIANGTDGGAGAFWDPYRC